MASCPAGRAASAGWGTAHYDLRAICMQEVTGSIPVGSAPPHRLKPASLQRDETHIGTFRRADQLPGRTPQFALASLFRIQ